MKKEETLGTYVFAVAVNSANGLFLVDLEDNVVGKHLRQFGQYGLDEIERLKPYITLESRVLIVGAHIGALAIPISIFCKEVVAIEANPITYNLLTKNLALNAVTNCYAINIAASDKEEEICFLLNRQNSGGSKRVPIKKEYMYYYDDPEEIEVKAVSLDLYLNNTNFDVVVMDIEGSEYFALQGMQNILSQCKLLAIEFLPHHLKNVSSVTVEQFLSAIPSHFSRLTIPSQQVVLNAPDFLRYLSKMYDRDCGDNGILFESRDRNLEKGQTGDKKIVFF